MLNHLGIIMDGNRRWAKSRALPSFMGHRAWAENVEKIVELCIDRNIKYLTLWALSLDNLQKRWEDEVKEIIGLINSMEKYLEKSIKNGLRFDTIWDIDRLPEESQKVLKRMKENTKNNDKIIVNIALIYWWQDEIIRAIKKASLDNVDFLSLKREDFRKYLDTWKLPVVDLIIRTWGDIRHSWFLLYDSEYSEYYFTPKKWPEFGEDEFNKAIEFFESTKRNFGG